MLALIRRLFRRDPPHLRGRVPVDCGVGTLIETAPPPTKADLSYAKHYGVGAEKVRENLARHYYAAQQQQVTPQEEARHRNNSGPPTVFEEEALRQRPRGFYPLPTPEEVERGRCKGAPEIELRPSYDAAFASARNKAERAANAGQRDVTVTADEYMAVHFTVSMWYDPSPPKGPTDLMLATPHGMVRLEVAKPDPAENARRYSKEGGTW